ncbi:MAG: histidine kinase [Coleofasciculaceae cyanobacterium SM2_1_6]|nr:histidine kinase [Coleofasciculaceae cyanobacterium SM2_1_6]
MDSGKQEILGYFIDEANEHLETLEKGLLELKAVISDNERMNELFRAAHSVKGGAAMLGYTSIQSTAHQLEDGFKILKEYPIKIDQQLETLFLSGYDILKELVEKLQTPYGLQDDEATRIMQSAQPTFAQLQSYLQRQSGGAPAPVPIAKSTTTIKIPDANFAPQTINILRQMLQLFKQKETPNSRQQLQSMCSQLAQMERDRENWQTLIKAAQAAIANNDNSYQALAPVVIKEIKQASDWIQTGKNSAIAPSPALQKLSEVAKVPQVMLPLEPRAAAKVIIQQMTKHQIRQLIEILEAGTR